ncbi:zincin-like metallopeptidase toxin domain-containing protein [Paenibacillus provencensis]|uniref:Zincin-like metallopeptidase toxin domain-containing protein n=1 Tax=Paenibacillus provencensis TaxID=441151 RepID=A0ABW3PV14_9BACL|nr:zincin-like metallopeptidase toxin domain-containing protein [Paenibacillus sp. MER 78]MCM3128053.1 hypothetical protein [Paenibacillus sp. MER 78]
MTGKVLSESYDYRKVNRYTNSNGEALATRKEIKEFKKKWNQLGVPVVVDKKRKILTGDFEAAFDYVEWTDIH